MTALRSFLISVAVLVGAWAAVFFSLRVVFVAVAATRDGAEAAAGLVAVAVALFAADFCQHALDGGTARGYFGIKLRELRVIPSGIKAIPSALAAGSRDVWRVLLGLMVVALVVVAVILAYLVGAEVFGHLFAGWPRWAVVITILLVLILLKR